VQNFDFVIIGAGPAGLTASLYASRAGLKTAMIEYGAPGGKLLKTYLIENYPGVPEMPGPDLGIQMYQQAMKFGTEYIAGEVKSISADKLITMADGQQIQAKAILIATGTTERMLNIPGEQDAIGHGESFCAVCDGAFFRNQDVVVIGGGNSALEESQFLTRFAKKVTIVMRRSVFRADAKLQKDAQDNEKIEILQGYIPIRILMEDGSVSGIELENVNTHEKKTLACAGVFPYIGQDPNSAFAKDLGITDEKGYIITDKSMKTAVDGIYAAGDVIKKDLRQVVTATGEGAIAAQDAFHKITGM
jgi:thioredoxin reductase (NADPH)